METIKNFGYVLASKRLVDEKLSVGFMYREHGSDKDSGWRFFAGDEEQKDEKACSFKIIYELLQKMQQLKSHLLLYDLCIYFFCFLYII